MKHFSCETLLSQYGYVSKTHFDKNNGCGHKLPTFNRFNKESLINVQLQTQDTRNAGLMLIINLRRWTNIKPTSRQSIVLPHDK